MRDDNELLRHMADAVRHAIEITRASGMWTAHIKDGKLIRIYPDGRIVQLKDLTLERNVLKSPE